MAVTIELPPEVERDLRRQVNNFDHAVKEALLVELYRQDKVSHHQLAQALGLDRLETDGLLKRHNVVEDFPTQQEYDGARKRLERAGHA